eukprot:gnl/MRDRNA2_/MRDRNA2_107175_c0_seq1.p1 gnl/MRDRNA2_/MRDRNA2_107175_c0~~gnl/MRDRNA2_/MRDRNA2_107175_c0_seq1.p1  ORF type:complete len:496 (+),score=109.48 gnl/MRDRNA2_/MRDRNA2_107175_c0_seq1:70-1557(+)
MPAPKAPPPAHPPSLEVEYLRHVRSTPSRSGKGVKHEDVAETDGYTERLSARRDRYKAKEREKSRRVEKLKDDVRAAAARKTKEIIAKESQKKEERRRSRLARVKESNDDEDSDDEHVKKFVEKIIRKEVRIKAGTEALDATVAQRSREKSAPTAKVVEDDDLVYTSGLESEVGGWVPSEDESETEEISKQQAEQARAVLRAYAIGVAEEKKRKAQNDAEKSKAESGTKSKASSTVSLAKKRKDGLKDEKPKTIEDAKAKIFAAEVRKRKLMQQLETPEKQASTKKTKACPPLRGSILFDKAVMKSRSNGPVPPLKGSVAEVCLKSRDACSPGSPVEWSEEEEEKEDEMIHKPPIRLTPNMESWSRSRSRSRSIRLRPSKYTRSSSPAIKSKATIAQDWSWIPSAGNYNAPITENRARERSHRSAPVDLSPPHCWDLKYSKLKRLCTNSSGEISCPGCSRTFGTEWPWWQHITCKDDGNHASLEQRRIYEKDSDF